MCPFFVFGQGEVIVVSPISLNGNYFDSLSRSLLFINFEHHELHAGNMYEFTYTDGDFDSGDTLDYLIEVGDTNAHLAMAIDGQLKTSISLYRGSTHTNGAAQRAINVNEKFGENNTTKIYASNNDGTDGELRFEDLFGIDTGAGINSITSGGGSRAQVERVLRTNTKYLLRIISYTDNNVLSIELRWYEH